MGALLAGHIAVVTGAVAWGLGKVIGPRDGQPQPAK